MLKRECKSQKEKEILHEAVMLFLKNHDCDYSLFEKQTRKEVKRGKVYDHHENENGEWVKAYDVDKVPFEEILARKSTSWVFAHIKNFEPFAREYFQRKLDPYSWNDDFMHFVKWDKFYSEYRKAELEKEVR